MAIRFEKPLMAFGRRVSVPGCDDAPVVDVEMGDAKQITICYPYYENAGMLKRQIEHWNVFPDLVKAHLSAIIVDDGSPETPAVQVLADSIQPFPIKLYRIVRDVRWNWIAARNIAMHHAGDGWCILTDIDHMVPEGTAIKCIYGAHDAGVIYRFMRDEHTGEEIHPHANSWFMTREMFWSFGGYDEAYSGHYGSDGIYRRRCVKAARVRILSDKLIRYEHMGDSSTTRYLRKQPEDNAVRRILAERGLNATPEVLTFPYHEVAL